MLWGRKVKHKKILYYYINDHEGWRTWRSPRGSQNQPSPVTAGWLSWEPEEPSSCELGLQSMYLEWGTCTERLLEQLPTGWIFLKNLFIYYLWLCWVFVSVRGLSLVAASGGHSSSRCAGLSLSRPLSLRNTGSRRAGSVVVAHGPSCSAAYGIFPDQGSNPCPLHWQADSQPLRHQGSPRMDFIGDGDRAHK